MPKQRTFTSWEEIPVVFDLPVACVLTGRTYENLKKLCQQGKLPAFKVGNEWRFEKETFRRWMNDQMVVPIQAAG